MNDRHGTRPDTAVTDPAPTITSKARSDVWVVDRRTNSKAAGGGMTPTVPVPMSEPAPTFTSQSGSQWVFYRPATTVCGDPRLAFPGHHDAEHRSFSMEDGSIRITIEEAATLQTFGAGYPWQGTRSKQFEQIGNVVPPLMSVHVIAALLGLERTELAA